MNKTSMLDNISNTKQKVVLISKQQVNKLPLRLMERKTTIQLTMSTSFPSSFIDIITGMKFLLHEMEITTLSLP